MVSNRKKGTITTTVSAVVLMLVALMVGMVSRISNVSAQDAAQTTFATPEEALQSLSTAVKARDRSQLRPLFGASIKDILSGDEVQDRHDFEQFAESLAKKAEIDKQGNSKAIIRIGDDKWPFAIPLVRVNERWVFDTKTGVEELRGRHIGSNEESTSLVCQAYVLAQWDYFAEDDWDDDGVAEFAQLLVSSPGKRDGLYWTAVADEKASPLGPLISLAREEGYTVRKGGGRSESIAPFQGYYFKILTGQGPSAAGGKHGYVINGNMIAGFGLVAYPATWGKSGVMTFIVNQQGRVYQKDLGPATPQIVKAMSEYNPDPTWKLADVVD